MLTNTAAQQSSNETGEAEEQQKKYSHRHGTPVFWSASPQTQLANTRAAFTPCYQSAKAGLSSQCFLVSLEVSWTKESCKQGPEVSPVDTTKLKIRATTSYTVELQEMLCSHGPHCNHPGIVNINKRIHLPSLLHLLAPMR